MYAVAFLLFVLAFFAGAACGNQRRLQPVPVIAGQRWYVPGRGVVTVGGVCLDTAGFTKYVLIPGPTSWRECPTLKDWYASGARLVTDDTAEMLLAVSEVRELEYRVQNRRSGS